MNCKLVRRHIGAFVDRELDPTTQIEFERHLETCVRCQELLAFETSMHEQTRGALGGDDAPDHLWGRVLNRLDEIDEARQDHVGVPHARPMRWKQAWPIAAAAVALLVLGGVVGLPEGTSYQGASMGMLQDVVNLHSQKLPSDVEAAEPQQVVTYFRGKTPFPVKPAMFDGQTTAQLVGARYIRLGNKPAAALYYNYGGHRVTLLVFRDPGLVEDAQRTHVGGRELHYYNVGNHVVPIRQHRGLNYAFFGDLQRPALLELAANARVGN
ncbi:MAG: zf-HC2 domain-containing protein [Myxococcota bacterium]